MTQAIITRPMVIALDSGVTQQFAPKKEGGSDVPQPMSETEFRRLHRAGAAQRFIEFVEAAEEPPVHPLQEAVSEGEATPVLPDFEEMTKADIIRWALEHAAGVTIDGKAKKADIIAAIVAGLSA